MAAYTCCQARRNACKHCSEAATDQGSGRMFGIDSFELNKIAGGVLGACLGLMALGIVSDMVFSHRTMKAPGYDLPADEPASASAPKAPAVPLPELLAKADVKKGENVAKACHACHTFDKGGPNKVGPNLYGVVGRPIASHAGFTYSDALKAKTGDWTFDAIDHFVMNPRGYANGTKMAFGGEKDAMKRADLLLYLHSLSDSPVPLPTK